MPYLMATSCASSVLSLPTLTCRRTCRPVSFMVGPYVRHGPHQTAQKSTSTGLSLWTTSLSQLSAVSCTTLAFAMSLPPFSCDVLVSILPLGRGPNRLDSLCFHYRNESKRRRGIFFLAVQLSRREPPLHRVFPPRNATARRLAWLVSPRNAQAPIARRVRPARRQEGVGLAAQEEREAARRELENPFGYARNNAVRGKRVKAKQAGP